MFVVANRIPVAPGWEERFKQRFAQRAGQVELRPGFVRMQVLEPSGGDAPHVVLTTWQSEAAFEAWVASEDFRAAHRGTLPKEAFAGPTVLERHQVVVAAEKP